MHDTTSTHPHDGAAPAGSAAGTSYRRPGRGRRRVVAGLALALLGLTAACGGGDDAGAESAGGDVAATDSGGGVEMDAPAAADAEMADDAVTAEGSRSVVGQDDADALDATGPDSGVAPRAPAEGRLVIRTGRLAVVAEDLEAARDDVDRLVGRYGGLVADERTGYDDKGRLQTSRLTIRVPSPSFGAVMSALDDLGRVRDSSTLQEDVTTEVIDVASRIRTQEVSLQRLRAFLNDARTVQSMIRLEDEIARREADLASLRAQDEYLADQTSLSTIELTLQRKVAATPPPEPEPVEEAGFLTGLSSGWDALVGVLLVAATVLGALLPFALVLALVGVPVWLWLRSTRRRAA